MFSFIHIPKTAGTHLRASIKQKTPITEYYYSWNGDPENANITYGHYTYKFIKRLRPKSKIIAVVRNPIYQVLSNYRHYLSSPTTNFEPNIGQLPPGLTFMDFIKLQNIKNYQSKFVTPKELDNLEYVGITENMKKTTKDISKLIGIKLKYSENMQNISTVSYKPTMEELRWVELMNQDDMKLYYKAKERFYA